MKFARVIGRVTLNTSEPSYLGARFLLAMPTHPTSTETCPDGNSFVLYDNLGATQGDLIGYSDGGEASAPFENPTPCDAYNAAIIDTITYQPPGKV